MFLLSHKLKNSTADFIYSFSPVSIAEIVTNYKINWI